MAGTHIHWFTQDLRLKDNPAFGLHEDAEALLCVYVVDPTYFHPSRWQSNRMGSHRWQFIQESLSDLNDQLQAKGQQLYVFYGDTVDILSDLIVQYQCQKVTTPLLSGSYEKKQVRLLKQAFPEVSIHLTDAYTLFEVNHLPMPLEALPTSYSRFRKRAEGFPVSAPTLPPSLLPPRPKHAPRREGVAPEWLPQPTHEHPIFKGGEMAAHTHLKTYLSSGHPKSYKTTRNELSGWESSSKLSPWLNQGCLSPRQIKTAIMLYEQSYGANESTHWLYVELLWREYFQWLHHRIQDDLFHFQGLAQSPPLTSFYPERFKKWCEGKTPYGLVNACMNELRETGYLSNRGRQIAASCLINELHLDWRYGAAWFEHHLVDYDVAVNWGNWQYIAGVGVDPRGGRHFNIEKQTELYDPKGTYRRKWRAQSCDQLDSVDAADWPIELKH